MPFGAACICGIRFYGLKIAPHVWLRLSFGSHRAVSGQVILHDYNTSFSSNPIYQSRQTCGSEKPCDIQIALLGLNEQFRMAWKLADAQSIEYGNINVEASGGSFLSPSVDLDQSGILLILIEI